jgi:hypothetical protein
MPLRVVMDALVQMTDHRSAYPSVQVRDHILSPMERALIANCDGRARTSLLLQMASAVYICAQIWA